MQASRPGGLNTKARSRRIGGSRHKRQRGKGTRAAGTEGTVGRPTSRSLQDELGRLAAMTGNGGACEVGLNLCQLARAEPSRSGLLTTPKINVKAKPSSAPSHCRSLPCRFTPVLPCLCVGHWLAPVFCGRARFETRSFTILHCDWAASSAGGGGPGGNRNTAPRKHGGASSRAGDRVAQHCDASNASSPARF